MKELHFKVAGFTVICAETHVCVLTYSMIHFFYIVGYLLREGYIDAFSNLNVISYMGDKETIVFFPQQGDVANWLKFYSNVYNWVK